MLNFLRSVSLVAKIHYSNRIESLIDTLGDNLYRDNDPLARRVILFPSGAMRDYAQKKLAESLGILMGVELLDLKSGLARLVEWSGRRPSPDGVMPSGTELALGIEYEIQKLDDPALAHWRRESRATGLSLELSTLFRLYSTFGTEMVTEWRKGGGGWQGEIWRKLFYERGHGWTHDQHLLQAVEGAIADGGGGFPKSLQVHFFSWSFFPKRHLDLFLSLGNQIETHFYFLSPTEMYWGDLQSDRERKRLALGHRKRGVVEERVTELDLLLRERNPLLANFGKMGREMVKTVEGHQVEGDEIYRVTQGVVEKEEYHEYFIEKELMEPTGHPVTILEAIQADLLFLRNPYSLEGREKIAIGENRSVQFHIADSKRREVEALYDKLRDLFGQKKLEPQEVIVMAPEIKDYIPYIHQVFGSDSSEIPYRAMDLSTASQSQLMRGILLMLNLEISRWNVAHLFELIGHPSFKSSRKWTEEEKRTMVEWIEKSGIHWGIDGSHRGELLSKSISSNYSSPQGTWEEGFSKLLDSLLESAGIETSLWELLGELIDLIRSLYRDMKPILNRMQKQISEWREYFLVLFDRYFVMSEEERERVEGMVGSLSSGSPIVSGAKFSFASIKVHLEAILSEENETYQKNQLHGVRFCSMRPMRAIPADCLVLMGMNDGAFPRQEIYRNLNLLWSEGSGDYCPSRADFDRYLFLEALLSARKYLLIYYQGYQDGVETPPALPARELKQYIEQAYELPGSIEYRHSHHAYDPKAFRGGEGKTSHYRLARALLAEREPVHRPWTGGGGEEVLEREEVGLADLVLLAKDPIKYYLRTRFNLRWREEDELVEDEPLLIPRIKMGELRQLALTEKAGKVIDYAMLRGWLPEGLSGKEARKGLEREIEEIQNRTRGYGVELGEVWTVEIKPGVAKAEQLGEKHWIAPGPIEGVLKNVTSKGLLTLGKSDQKSILREMPNYLALKEVEIPGVEKRLITAREEGNFSGGTVTIGDYIAYEKKASRMMSPLLPEWVVNVMKHRDRLEEVTCHKEIYEKHFYYPAVQWALEPLERVSGEELFGPWEEEINTLFATISSEWFPGGKGGNHE